MTRGGAYACRTAGPAVTDGGPRWRDARERARAEQSWKIQPKRSGDTAMLHRGGCTLYNSDLGFLDRDEAITAMREPGIEPCEICRPETELT
ncbi:DUF6233 domain-containing protein [Streptomyces sp. NPDC101194]|uniref:DUF6233 domain-containing protein n=1 Tax=Streptomyces sp. NPDC101194 TaxID=3366127 RepID=UPI003804DDAE